MSIETHRVLIGSCGWQYPQWQQSFYDEELPTDWQLGFYANEFPVVYLPAAAWLQQNQVEEWPDEVVETFRFILELPLSVMCEPEQASQVMQLIDALGEFCLAVVLQLDAEAETVLIDQALQAITQRTAACIDAEDDVLSAGLRTLMQQHRVARLWNGEGQPDPAIHSGKVAVCRCEDKNLDMPELRRVVEGCLSLSAEDCISVLCLDGEPPSIEKMRNADVILNLL